MLNRKILIVDDNPDIHSDFKKILAPKVDDSLKLDDLGSLLFGEDTEKAAAVGEVQYEIHSAYQGLVALQMVTDAIQQGQPYAMIFVDVRMPPGLDGIETTKRIWELAPITEVVLCTAYSDYTHAEFLAVLGLSHRLLFLKKPFDAVAVKQLALATTTKWNFEADVRNHTEQLEKAVQERTKELVSVQSMLMLSAKMSALGEMAGGVAHEINTPLGILTLNCDIIEGLLEEKELDLKKLRSTNHTSLLTVERIGKIIRGLLNFSRDGSKDPVKPALVLDLVKDTVALCQEGMRARGVMLTLENIDPSLIVNCRFVEISQVLLNLLNNAMDAIDKTSEKWIVVSAFLIDKKVLISVTDSGPGIPSELQKKMFNPFFTTKSVGKGTGLGLSISQNLALANGGSLTYGTNSPNTKFVLQLPGSIGEPHAKVG